MSDATITGPADVVVSDITYDSRAVTPGALFVAVPTVGGDPQSGGARFIKQAMERGASVVVVPSGVDVCGITAVRVPDPRAALADLACAFFNRPSERLQLFGVTGTDGKTTTTYLLDGILSHSGCTTGLLGTVEIKIGDRRESNLERMTTPESADVQRLLSTMVERGVTHVAMEASSHALALERLRGCHFTACALTNITADHVEFHGSWDAYFAAKARLFTELGRGQPAIINQDDPHTERLVRLITGPVTTYGLSSRAEVWASDVEATDSGTRFQLHGGRESVRVDLALIGQYNVANALAAVGLALTTGLPLEAIANGLSSAQPPPGRLQAVTEGQPYQVLVDYAHTIHAFESVLDTLRGRTPSPSQLIVVFGAAGNRDRAKRPVLARIARKYADFFIVTNEDPYGEDAETIIDEIMAGVPSAETGIRFEREVDRGQAIVRAVQRARAGDTVVVLGKGHEQSIVTAGYKQPWSDVSAVRDAIKASQ